MASDPSVAPDTPGDVTSLLVAWGDGDRAALDALLPAVYDELRRQAARALRQEAPGHVLQPTALVHEAYLRLVDQRRARWDNRAHFFGAAAELMRRILVDHARTRRAAKRGGGATPVTLDDAAAAAPPVDVLDLDDALTRLAAMDPQQARVVELRYFGGLNIEETAATLGVSRATVNRDWATARVWLRRELGGR